MNTLYRLLFFAIPFGFLFSPSAWGAGLILYEQGTPDVGTANAGRAARAEDASTTFGNPAGMTRLKRSQLMTTIQPLLVKIKFDTSSGTTQSGGNGGDAGDTVMSAGVFYVHNVTEKLKIGVTSGSYFGAGIDYGDSWAGRYYVQDAEFFLFSINPVVAYRMNDWLSIGGGFSINKAELIQRTAINNILPFYPDGQLKAKDDDVAFGGDLGILVEPKKGTRFGLTYRSEVELDFKDTLSARGVGPLLSALVDRTGIAGSRADLEMTIPQMVMLSGYHQLSEKLAIMGNVGWQEHSAYGKTNVAIQSASTRKFTSDRNFKDTWHFAIGMQYRIDDPWLFSLGFAYDESPVDREDRTPDMPLDRQYRYGTGIQYEWNTDVTVGFAYEYVDFGDAAINQFNGELAGKLVGDYKTNAMHVFAFNLNWKF